MINRIFLFVTIFLLSFNVFALELFKIEINKKDESASKIYELVRACYPKPFKFPINIELRGGVGQNIVSQNDLSTNDVGRYYAGIVFSIPLWNEGEKERARNDERNAHQHIIETIQIFLTNLETFQLKSNQLALYNTLEIRSKQRVDEGVVSTDEQIGYIEKIIETYAEVNTLRHSIELAKLSLTGMCELQSNELEAYLNDILKGKL